jgi:flagellar biosynthesis/type III secretory pathway chaperone
MTWFDLVKSSEMKEFEMLAEKYAKPNDMKHLDYLRKKHGKKSNEFYDTLEKQVENYLTEDWVSIQDIIKSLREQNPGLKDSDENLTAFLRKRLEAMDIKKKQEPAVGRTGKKTFYKV